MTFQAWAAGVPPTFTPTLGATIAARALSDARAAVDDVARSFAGTVPPPPWPAGPALVKAMDTMDGARIAFERIAMVASPPTYARTDKVGVALLRAGSDLYSETAKLVKARDDGKDLTKMAAALIPSLGGGTALIAALVVLYMVRGKL